MTGDADTEAKILSGSHRIREHRMPYKSGTLSTEMLVQIWSRFSGTFVKYCFYWFVFFEKTG
jgi:hypothetical protein